MKLKNINASYKDKQIYDNVSVDFDQVGMTFIKGDSGSGKTTLLNILYGLKSFEGEYLVEGEIDDFIRNNMAYIFQDFKIDTNLTVYENIVLQLQIKDISIDVNYINNLLDEFDMLENKNKKAKVLSGGEKQRLAIIRALVTKPAILLCDEPTGNLDEDKSFEIFDLLKEISKTKLVLVVSHNEILIERYADVVYKILDKQLVTDKDSKLAPLTYSDSKYGKIGNKELVKKSFMNFKHHFFKKLSMFIVFSLLASLFLVLNFSKEANANYIAEKFSTFESKDTIYVKFKRLKSINYLEDLTNDLGLDGFMIDSITMLKSRGNSKFFDIRQLPELGFVTIEPQFITEEIVNKYRDDFIDEHQDLCDDNPVHCQNVGLPALTRNTYPIIAVSDFNNLKPSLIAGRMPLNDSEALVNIIYIEVMINVYNELIVDNDLDLELLEYENMSIEEINDFFDANNLYLDYIHSPNNDWRKVYIKQSIYDRNYNIVGVVNDKYYGFDSNIYATQIGNDTLTPYAVYISKELYMDEAKIRSTYYIDRQKYKQNPFIPNSVTFQDVLDDDSIDMNEVDFLHIVSLHKKDLNIHEYINYVSELEKNEDIKEVLVDNMYASYLLELAKIDRINDQINIYSLFILLVAFLTSYIPYYMMIKSRKSEYFMYQILGMNNRERFRLYFIEFLFLTTSVSTMIVISYFGFSLFLESQLCELFSSLIYSSRIDELVLNFRFNELVVVFMTSIPFIFTYKFLENKKY